MLNTKQIKHASVDGSRVYPGSTHLEIHTWKYISIPRIPPEIQVLAGLSERAHFVCRNDRFETFSSRSAPEAFWTVSGYPSGCINPHKARETIYGDTHLECDGHKLVFCHATRAKVKHTRRESYILKRDDAKCFGMDCHNTSYHAGENEQHPYKPAMFAPPKG